MADPQRTVLIETVTALVAIGLTTVAACALVGIARSTYYRVSAGYQHYTPVTAPIAQRDRVQPAALSAAERTQVRQVLTQGRAAGLSVCQTYWRAFDSGLMPCSPRTAYRIATTAELVGDRRRGRHSNPTTRRAPNVAATGPGDLWSWDVTELRGPGRERYRLYLAIDVYSRFPVAWRIEYTEDQNQAVQMFRDAFDRYGPPKVLHADNGAVMRSHLLLDAIAAAGTEASFSRPRVSDDNPFSESLFKTIKYDLACPERFESIEHARTWTEAFLHGYAADGRHSGLGWHTPATVFDGTAHQHRQRRQHRLDAMYAACPQRYRRPPRAPEIPTHVGINNRKSTNQHLSQTG